MKNKEKIKLSQRLRRKARVRAKIFGTQEKPRLSIYRSLKYISAQLINDDEGKTLVAVSDRAQKHPFGKLRAGKNTETQKALKHKNTENTKTIAPLTSLGADKNTTDKELKMTKKIAIAFEVGKLLAKKALEKDIKKCVFDKSYYKYHGRIKALAEGAREGGLQF